MLSKVMTRLAEDYGEIFITIVHKNIAWSPVTAVNKVNKMTLYERRTNNVLCQESLVFFQ